MAGKFEALLDAQRTRPWLMESFDFYDLSRRFKSYVGDVVELLGEAQPCGGEPPEVTTFHGDRMILWRGDLFSPNEARALAAMLLRAADEAEAT